MILPWVVFTPWIVVFHDTQFEQCLVEVPILCLINGAQCLPGSCLLVSLRLSGFPKYVNAFGTFLDSMGVPATPIASTFCKTLFL